MGEDTTSRVRPRDKELARVIRGWGIGCVGIELTAALDVDEVDMLDTGVCARDDGGEGR